MRKEELKYLQRLAELYPTIASAATEIINLQSILNLPKGTEHFLTDIHGEYEAFSHVLCERKSMMYSGIRSERQISVRLPHSSTTRRKKWNS